MNSFSAIILALLFLPGCDNLSEVVTEMHQIQETCSVVNDPAIFNQYGFDLISEVAIKHTLYLAKEKRWYLSGCGIVAFMPESSYKSNLEAIYPEEGRNPVNLVTYVSFKSKSQLKIPYKLRCNAGDLGSSSGVWVDTERKYILIDKKTDGYACALMTEPGSPKISDCQSGLCQPSF